MEESNQTTQPALASTAPAKPEVTPAAIPNPQVMQPAPGGIEQGPRSNESKMMLWLIGGLVVIIIVVGGIYFYLTGQQKKSQPKGVSPTPQVQENLENELNAINVEDIEQEFSSVDQDLETL